MTLRLRVLPWPLAICRLPPRSPVPAWATAGPLWCVAGTADELSLVCAEASVPAGVTRQSDFRALQVIGPLDFAATGIVAALTAPLAAAAIPVFVFSTYDTDYLLVRAPRLEPAVLALASAGFVVEAAEAD